MRKTTSLKAPLRKRAMRAGGLVFNTAATQSRVLMHLVGNTKTALIRNDKMQGRSYVVVPVVMMTVGVHNGSQGPILYTAEELGKRPQVWNNKPLVVYHPQINGEGVGACDPDILTTYSIGVIMNTKFDKAGRLTCEAWIEEERADAVDKRIMEAVRNKKMMEVSTGLYTDNEPAEDGAEWEGEAYDAIARNVGPDHLALLPDQIGACSIKDGAGFIRNQLNSSIAMLTASKREAAHQQILSTLKDLNLLEASYEQKRDMLSSALQKKFPPPEGAGMGYSYPWIEAVFDEYIIFCMGGKLFKLSYSATDGAVKLAGDASEVIRVTEYKSAKDGAYVGNAQPENQPNKDTTMDKKTIVDGLIGNAASGFNEADRSYLMGLPVERLTAFATNAAPKTEPAAKPAQVETVKPAAVINAEPAKPTLNEAQLAALAYGERRLKEDKAKLVGTITGNKANKFSAEVLNAMSIEQLEGIAALAVVATPVENKGSANYGMQGGQAPAANTECTETPLPLPVYNFEKAPAKAQA